MSHVELVRHLSHPLDPIATDAEPYVEPVVGIRAVLFDVYGTLFVSASGDIGLTGISGRGGAFREAMSVVGIQLLEPPGDGVKALEAEIRRQHAASATAFPEVEIRDVWRKVLQRLQEHGSIANSIDHVDIERLAVEYEMRVNPVWPMPGLAECLAAIRAAGLPLGIVSNAQFFTPLLFPALLNRSLEDLGFYEDLCVWSHAHLQAKPGTFLYELAAAALAARSIAPSQALYVGNDLRNDIAPAAAVGFRPVLFAGDARSLRLHEGDPSIAGVQPDRTLTDLRQILDVLRLAES